MRCGATAAEPRRAVSGSRRQSTSLRPQDESDRRKSWGHDGQHGDRTADRAVDIEADCGVDDPPAKSFYRKDQGEDAERSPDQDSLLVSILLSPHTASVPERRRPLSASADQPYSRQTRRYTSPRRNIRQDSRVIRSEAVGSPGPDRPCGHGQL